MTQLIWFRSIGLCAGILLAIYSIADISQELTRPALRTASFFASPAVTTAADEKINLPVPWITFNGKILSDQAAAKSQLALNGNSVIAPDRTARNSAAQAASAFALGLSPINATGWLILGLLKAQMEEAPTGPLKMSYFTGPIAADGLVPRIHVVTGTGAVLDDDIRLLVSSDVRTILTRYGLLEPALEASYRQAPADGKALLMETIRVVDPKFGTLLRRYQ
jgi:hypothetical protein